jgi:hypothetical protein
MATIGDVMKSRGKEIEIQKNDIAIFKNLIQEHIHPLDLIRELLSNAGAREVGATRIEIGYTHAKEGHIFEIGDNGCGMDYTDNATLPGRLDRFLGLGLSAIGGEKAADEFSWKGLGSKLAYQSKRVEIETRFDGHPFYIVRINEPWSSLERNLLPSPYIAEYPESDEKPGSRIKVTGHPPHSLGEPFTFTDIKAFLLHRTFAGYTRHRDNPPEIGLSVIGRTEELEFGFPEFRGINWSDGITLEEDRKRLLINILERSSSIGLVRLKGFLVWQGDKYGLIRSNQNIGLILSSRGIPYFEIDMEDYGARSIQHANPGIEKTCLVVEADGVYSKMNISRSGLVDAAETLELKRLVKKLFERVETSPEYLEFRQIPKVQKEIDSADHLAVEKRAIEAEDQNWVVYQRPPQSPLVLMREPKNETEVLALIWKLESLNGLPFKRFETLAYVGAAKGPDLLVNFQEEEGAEPSRGAVIEVENNFYNYKSHGHKPAQYARVVCWDIPSSGRKARLNKTTKKFKWTINMDEYQVHVFVLKMMEGISVASRRQLKEIGIEI